MLVKEEVPEQKRIITALAEKCRMPIAELEVLYAHERVALALGACITKYLEAFTARKRTLGEPGPGGS